MNRSDEPSRLIAARPRIPAGIWALGFVSMLMDISSEMIHSLLPLFLMTQLGVGAMTVGLIEGVAEGPSDLAREVRAQLLLALLVRLERVVDELLDRARAFAGDDDAAGFQGFRDALP